MSSSKYAVFLKVAELGSMSKAAMHCNYSQSAVSQIISSLEDELQMTLLNRSQSGVTLTASGEQMLPYIRHLRDAADAVNEQAAKLKGLEVGHIRIGTFSSVSCHVLAPVLKEFKAVHPASALRFARAMMPVSTQCCCGMRSILAFWTHRLPRDSTLF